MDPELHLHAQLPCSSSELLLHPPREFGNSVRLILFFWDVSVSYIPYAVVWMCPPVSRCWTSNPQCNPKRGWWEVIGPGRQSECINVATLGVGKYCGMGSLWKDKFDSLSLSHIFSLSCPSSFHHGIVQCNQKFSFDIGLPSFQHREPVPLCAL